MARTPLPYDHRAAVAYAHAWAYRRNPIYYDYNESRGRLHQFRLPVPLRRRGG